MRILIIGAGIFGTSAGLTLAGKEHTVDIIEEQPEIMQLASRVNHNRIHLGYHYLRSIETAEQSIEGLLSFLFNYGGAVIHQLPNYYAIAKNHSKTSPQQFSEFCNKVGIGYDISFPASKLLNREKIEACFKVPEPVWDYKRLKQIISSRLRKANVNVLLNSKCTGLTQLANNTFEVLVNDRPKYYDVVINATYANAAEINTFLGIPPQRLLFEDVVILKIGYATPPIGLTVMDGEFCSVMPHGKQPKEFLLYHVRDSIIRSEINMVKPIFSKLPVPEVKIIKKIIDNSETFFPFIKNAAPLGLSRTTRVVHQNSDDARITELQTFDEIPNYFSLFSGKVTTCVQAALEIKHILQGRQVMKRMKI